MSGGWNSLIIYSLSEQMISLKSSQFWKSRSLNVRWKHLNLDKENAFHPSSIVIKVDSCNFSLEQITYCTSEEKIINKYIKTRTKTPARNQCLGRTGGQVQTKWLSLRNKWLKFETSGELPIILEESIEHTSNE